MRLLLLSLLLAPSMLQEHAPTVDTCRADSSVWNRDLPLYKGLSETELMKRAGEMSNCQTVDPAREGDTSSLLRYIGYQRLEVFYRGQSEFRAVNFITRHGLWKQFEKEDEPNSR